MTTGKLILLRHGQSQWNASNQFTGWVDVALTEKGEEEARHGGELLREANILPDVVYTSLQRRAINTANLALDAADRLWIPVVRDWRLNERHYGGLQGLNKAETAAKYGDEQVHIWRRSFDIRPPKMEEDNEYSARKNPAYRNLSVEDIPMCESLKDTIARTVPYFEVEIKPQIMEGKRVFIAAHGNSLRSLIKYFENISDEEIINVEIPTGTPLVYEFDDDFKVTNKYYLK